MCLSISKHLLSTLTILRTMKVPHALLILLAADQMAIESGVSAFLAPLPCPVKMIKPKFEVVGNVVSRLNCGSRIILKAADADEEPTTVIQIEDLTQSQIVELIEVTFINACMVRRVARLDGLQKQALCRGSLTKSLLLFFFGSNSLRVMSIY